jgi:pilus assembly protein Flp/PilA
VLLRGNEQVFLADERGNLLGRSRSRVGIALAHRFVIAEPQRFATKGRTKMKNALSRLVKEEDGGTAVEYGLITAVIAVALIAALVAFREEIVGLFTRAGGQIRSST